MREEWILYLMEYYRDKWPNSPLEAYRRWSEATLDRELVALKDYISLDWKQYFQIAKL